MALSHRLSGVPDHSGQRQCDAFMRLSNSCVTQSGHNKMQKKKEVKKIENSLSALSLIYKVILILTLIMSYCEMTGNQNHK